MSYLSSVRLSSMYRTALEDGIMDYRGGQV